MTLARLVHFVLPTSSILRIPAHRIAAVFVGADIVTFIIQGIGLNVVKIGINVYMAGIGLQEAFIIAFVVLMIAFQRKAKELEQRGVSSVREKRWRTVQYSLYAVLVAITVRIIYRIAEYAGGLKPSNPVPFHEAYSYALDAFPMMVALLLLAIFHPGRVLQGPQSQLPSRKERREAKKQRKALEKNNGSDIDISPMESGAMGESRDSVMVRSV